MVRGIDQVNISSSGGKALSKGIPQAGNINRTFSFDRGYQLIGLKGLSTATSLASLGFIVFDSLCDVENPDGPKLSPADVFGDLGARTVPIDTMA